MRSDQLPKDLDYTVHSLPRRSSNWVFAGIAAMAFALVGIAVYTVLSHGANLTNTAGVESARFKQLEVNQAKLTADIDRLSKQLSELVERVRALEERRAADAVQPVSGSAAHVARTYTVQLGDTLGKISTKMYGSSSQYKKIYEANRDKLSTPSSVIPGMVLQIPE